MYDLKNFFINGEWVEPAESKLLDVINPATEEVCAQISLGGHKDVDKAVAAARAAFPSFSQTTREQRIACLESIIDHFKKRYDEIANAITMEMGAPTKLATTAQAGSGISHLVATLKALKDYDFEEDLGGTRVVKEAIGVCGFITPWNWPINQIACKVAPAIAAGCTMVLKPSEVAPLSAHVFARAVADSDLPPGVFNLVDGDGPGVGAYLSSHPDVDMMSFTGSTRAGILVAKAAADTVKRVAQELGGKSPNIILEDADLAKAVTSGVFSCMSNTGQSCNAPSRMLIHEDQYEEAIEFARAAAEKIRPGDPTDPSTRMGPVVSEIQYDKIQTLIQRGIDEGATVVIGGTGRPEGLENGYFVRPTIFAHANNEMTIAKEEIFGPVLTMIPYQTEEQAIAIANDTPYGLSSYLSSGDQDRARRVAARLRTGMVHLNGSPTDEKAPFGGYKQSGNGREWGAYGMEEFLEVKAIMGFEG
ncbi:MAG: aldehyde dehydrogenase family protein [Pseudomonadota bacterium]